MMDLRSFWRFWLKEPLIWIFLVFFQPTRLRREFEPATFRQGLRRTVRLMLPMILVASLFTFIGRALLLPFHIYVHTDGISFWIDPVAAIIAIIITIFIYCVIFRIIVGGAATGVAFSIAGSIHIDAIHSFAGLVI